jgi:hypothetical protein
MISMCPVVKISTAPAPEPHQDGTITLTPTPVPKWEKGSKIFNFSVNSVSELVLSLSKYSENLIPPTLHHRVGVG